MAENWKAPGSEIKIKYRVIQFASGEWAIEQSETKCIAWFPDRGGATCTIRKLLPANAEREY
jgi:hypothetical protein